jgi:hypothetical protein
MSLVCSLRGVQANPEPCNSNSNSIFAPLLLLAPAPCHVWRDRWQLEAPCAWGHKNSCAKVSFRDSLL